MTSQKTIPTSMRSSNPQEDSEQGDDKPDDEGVLGELRVEGMLT